MHDIVSIGMFFLYKCCATIIYHHYAQFCASYLRIMELIYHNMYDILVFYGILICSGSECAVWGAAHIGIMARNGPF